MRPESLYFLFSPVTRIKGIGTATAKALTNLLPAATAISGATIPIIRDLLFHLPVGFLDRRVTYPLHQVPDGAIGTFVVTVDEHRPPKRRGKSPYKVICSNETGDITLVFFNAREDYILNTLPIGQKRVISGRVEHFDFAAQMPHPDIIAPLSQLAEVQRTEAVYPLTLGITSRRISKIVSDAMEKLPELPEWLTSPVRGEVEAHSAEGGGKSGAGLTPTRLPRNKCGVGDLPPHGGGGLSWKSALQQVHHPQSSDDLLPTAAPRMRLAQDEILAHQLHLALLRKNMQLQAGEVVTGTGKLTGALLASLPFTLTKGQRDVLAEIEADMASGHRMGRLLQGDVGSGKTIVALLAMLRAAEQGLQSALMVPTEIIAQQHFERISSLLTTCHPPLATTLLTGSVKGKAREEVLEKIKSGGAKIIVGTHALFQEHVEFKNLAFAVIDEQHRFGVGQRMALTHKGNAPHILHMSATPIPRSLTMTLYGDMDISQLVEKPAGRQSIVTRMIPLTRYGEIMERLKVALDRGEKAYWICPLIEDNSTHGDADIAAAKSRFTEFKARFGNRVGLVHGRMKADERNNEMRKFAEGETALLVATTVVEVGVDVKDATIMVIERAERFGLSQLHQLRGRVGRGEKLSSCVLLYSEVASGKWQVASEEKNSLATCHLPLATERLSILRETDDGFKIAEADLAQRGGGDLLGTRQSGLPRFIFTDFGVHQELLAGARDDNRQFLTIDPELATPRGQALRLLLQLFGYDSAP